MPVGASALRTTSQVGRHGVARSGDAGVRWAAELELAAGLEGDLAATGKRVGQDAADHRRASARVAPSRVTHSSSMPTFASQGGVNTRLSTKRRTSSGVSERLGAGMG